MLLAKLDARQDDALRLYHKTANSPHVYASRSPLIMVSPYGLVAVTRGTSAVTPRKGTGHTLRAVRVYGRSIHSSLVSITRIGAERKDATQRRPSILVMLHLVA